MSLLGPSGCGKSTALRIIAGLSEPTAGVVEWHADAAAESESRIGFVFQEPTLMPWTNVFNNVLLPLKLRRRRWPKRGERVAAALDRVGLQRLRATPIRANCRAACACGCRSRARSSPSRSCC